MKVSVAITSYNTNDYIKKAVDIFLNDNFFDEIIIQDDCSEVPPNINHPKIKMEINNQNLGAFKNKYKAVNNCKNDWVFLLDCDNNVDKKNIDTLKNSILSFSKNTLYFPNSLHLVNISLDEKLDKKIVDYSFITAPISMKDANNFLSNSHQIFEWFMNTGNFCLFRNNFLKVMKNLYESNEHNLLEADAFVFFYEWLKSGLYVDIIHNFQINHILRKDSYSHSTGNKNKNSLEFYKNKILSL